MPQSELRLVKRSVEFLDAGRVDQLPRGLRGIYVLYHHRPRLDRFDVVYVGMARSGRRGGIRGRLRQHRIKKADLWTHCSVFEVWDNIRDEEVVELEGLFRHIYRLDTRANRLNVQGTYKKLTRVEAPDLAEWRPARQSLPVRPCAGHWASGGRSGSVWHPGTRPGPAAARRSRFVVRRRATARATSRRAFMRVSGTLLHPAPGSAGLKGRF